MDSAAAFGLFGPEPGSKMVRFILKMWPFSAYARNRAKFQAVRERCDRAGERELRWWGKRTPK